ncbi:cation diffusion facilitator family transporter [Geofilum rhodophaeum]|uniref:cation diffusion facilitator family transporter n=1 Tax=Geofilum rhodophaeum TaxID=1965019 RepID=UPI000B521214|nr:cation diffusion facilitator family transporter [Geofilum rhodophaeum]
MNSYRKPIILSWLSIVLNLLLFGLKYWAGVVSNSVALIADAWHTLSDSISSLAVLIGLKYAQQPADEQHPYGHGRAELIASLVVGVLLAVVGFNFLAESVVHLRNRVAFSYGPAAIWVTVISVVVKEIMARYSITTGKKLKLSSLKADGWHHRSDALSSLVILLAIFLGRNIWWMDSVLGMLVSLLIFYTTWGILKDTMSALLGEGMEADMEQRIAGLSRQVEPSLTLQPHHFKLHRYGNHTELTFHIRLPGELSLDKAHEIASRYEILVEEQLNMVVTIHVDARTRREA